MTLNLEALETSFDLVAPRGDEHTAPGRSTIRSSAAQAWRLEHGRAWCEAFAIVAGAMIEGAESIGLEAAA